MDRPDLLLSWRGRRAGGTGLLADPVACRWEVPRSLVNNPFDMLCFYRDKLDRNSIGINSSSYFILRGFYETIQAPYKKESCDKL